MPLSLAATGNTVMLIASRPNEISQLPGAIEVR